MAAKQIVGLILTGLAAAWLAAGTVSAGEPAKAKVGESQAGGLADLLEIIGKPTFPSLSGLIRPEKMGILTDNPCQIRENEVEAELMSGNQTRILSGIHILSGITVDVHVTVRSGSDGASKDKAKKADDKRPSKKSRKKKARSRPNTAT